MADVVTVPCSTPFAYSRTRSLNASPAATRRAASQGKKNASAAATASSIIMKMNMMNA